MARKKILIPRSLEELARETTEKSIIKLSGDYNVSCSTIKERLVEAERSGYEVVWRKPGNQKISPEKRMEIFTKYYMGTPPTVLAEDYNITLARVIQIVGDAKKLRGLTIGYREIKTEEKRRWQEQYKKEVISAYAGEFNSYRSVAEHFKKPEGWVKEILNNAKAKGELPNLSEGANIRSWSGIATIVFMHNLGIPRGDTMRIFDIGERNYYRILKYATANNFDVIYNW